MQKSSIKGLLKVLWSNLSNIKTKNPKMNITVQELKQKMDNKEDFVLIDVREQHEYDSFNIGAQLIPLGQIANQLSELEEFKSKEVILHCRSGARSGRAQQFLMANGFTNVWNVTGGVLAWQEMVNV